jgi:hypothetical protein
MAKQVPDLTSPSSALAAFEKLQLKIPELRDRRRELAQQIAGIENVSRSGVPAVTATDPLDEAEDTTAAAFEMLNGSAIAAMPPKSLNDGVRLHNLQREFQKVGRAIEIGERQLITASIDAARESAAANLEQTQALHRQRALLLVSLLDLNEKIETLRLKVAVGGVSADGPLENFTARLFGAGIGPTVFNLWPRKYLAACLDAGIITKKELNT